MKRLRHGARQVAVTAGVASILFSVGLGMTGCSPPWTGGSSTTGGEAGVTSVAAPATTSQPVSTLGPETTVQPATTIQPATTVSPVTTVKPSTTTTSLRPGTDYTRLPTKDKVIALTFDAAYDPAPLEDILAALGAAGADATFFLTGEFVRDFPQWTKKIAAAGYPIGNHSYSHPDFTKLTDQRMRDEIRKTAAALTKLGVEDPKPLFRAPYGALSKRVLSVLKSEGYVSVFWTIDTLDWKPERTPAQIRAAVLAKLKPGAIILMHVGSKQTAQVLPRLLADIKAQGYGFVNLREALPAAVD